MSMHAGKHVYARPGSAERCALWDSVKRRRRLSCQILRRCGACMGFGGAAEEDEQMKASALFGPGWEGASLDVLWQDAERAFCRFAQDGPEGETYAFIPVLSGAGHPTPEIVNRFIREYE